MQLIFVRAMMENTLDQQEMETVLEMSRRIDEMMNERVRETLGDDEPAIRA